MGTASRLSEQLEALGMPASHWPDESAPTRESDAWIQNGLMYAEGIQLWQTQLLNLPESSKGVMQPLLRHLHQSNQLSPWEQVVIAFLEPDTLQLWQWDRLVTLENLIDRVPLTAAQHLGITLAMATNQQIGLAAKRMSLFLARNTCLSQFVDVIATFVIHANTSWHVREAVEGVNSWKTAIDLHQQLIHLLNQSLKQNGTADKLATKEIINDLQALHSTAEIFDQWVGLPRAKAEQLVMDGEASKAAEYLASELPAWEAPIKKAANARLMVCQLLVQMGRWQEAEKLHRSAVEEVTLKSMQIIECKADLDILRIETELLSGELSLALGNCSLKGNQWKQPAQETNADAEHWRTLSRSQLGQDLWVLERMNWKRGGFFVEFGATDGVLLSNSWLLEKYFDWKGICAEPNPNMFAKLQHNRSCQVSSACIYHHSGEQMRFVLADAYGGIEDQGQEDQHADKRKAYAEAGRVIEVTTTSLKDLLEYHKAPHIIDYLSIDTEGSELAILEGIDWNQFQFRCITVEHNFTAKREKIRNLLESQGYRCQEKSWDDWYWKELTQ